MDEILSFIESNSLWFIIIAIFIFLSLIGYIAEKSGFKKVEIPREEPKKKEEPKEEVEEVTETPNEVMSIDETASVEDLNAPVEEVAVSEEPTEEKPSKKKKKKKKKGKKEEVEEITPTFEDLNIVSETPAEGTAPVEDLSAPVTEPTVNFDVQPMEEDLNAPLTNTPEVSAPVVEEIPAELYAPLEGAQTPITEAPADLNQVTPPTEESQEDIWKF